jgi:hypothetical protein
MLDFGNSLSSVSESNVIWTQPYLRENATSASTLDNLQRIYRRPDASGGSVVVTVGSNVYTLQPDSAALPIGSLYKITSVNSYASTFARIDGVAFGPQSKCATYGTTRAQAAQNPSDWPTQFLAGRTADELELSSIIDLDDGEVLYSSDASIYALDTMPSATKQNAQLCALLSTAVLVCVNATGPAATRQPRQISLDAILPVSATPSSFAWSCRVNATDPPLMAISDWANDRVYLVEFAVDTMRATLKRTIEGIASPVRPTPIPTLRDEFLLKSDADTTMIAQISLADGLGAVRFTPTGTATIMFQNTAAAKSSARPELAQAQVPAAADSSAQPSSNSSGGILDSELLDPSNSYTQRTWFVIGACVFFVVGAISTIIITAIMIVRRNREVEIQRKLFRDSSGNGGGIYTITDEDPPPRHPAMLEDGRSNHPVSVPTLRVPATRGESPLRQEHKASARQRNSGLLPTFASSWLSSWRTSAPTPPAAVSARNSPPSTPPRGSPRTAAIVAGGSPRSSPRSARRDSLGATTEIPLSDAPTLPPVPPVAYESPRNAPGVRVIQMVPANQLNRPASPRTTTWETFVKLAMPGKSE